MRYFILAYLVFVLVFDFYGRSTQLWNVIYFSVQYFFAFGVSLYFMFNAKWGRIHFALPAAVFGSLAANELCMYRYCEVEYFYRVTDANPYYSWGATFILLTALLVVLKKLIK